MRMRKRTRRIRTPMRRTELLRSLGGVIPSGKSPHPDRLSSSHAMIVTYIKIIIIIIIIIKNNLI